MTRLMVEDAEFVCKRAESQVAGFSDSQRRFDGFEIAHFADQHHVRIFTECGAQRIAEALGVRMQLALVDHAVLVHVHEFDRIFDGQDVLVALGIDLVDHRGERRGFTGASRSGHENQSARPIAEFCSRLAARPS